MRRGRRTGRGVTGGDGHQLAAIPPRRTGALRSRRGEARCGNPQHATTEVEAIIATLRDKNLQLEKENRRVAGELARPQDQAQLVIDKNAQLLQSQSAQQVEDLRGKIKALENQLVKATDVDKRATDVSKLGIPVPELVVIPAGSFLMGSPEDDEMAQRDEKPQHRVQFAAPFAMGKYAVTFEEYDTFALAMGRKLPDDEGWGRGRRPVINVSWQDAVDYTKWLSEKTGETYRLPTEAEWEYTALVDAFEPNPWGLYNVHGNVWEWTQDCWNKNYKRAPEDGSAWSTGDCTLRVLRGGSWIFLPDGARAARRSWGGPDDRYNNVGFRVVRASPIVR